jgi:hypothetical protein
MRASTFANSRFFLTSYLFLAIWLGSAPLLGQEVDESSEKVVVEEVAEEPVEVSAEDSAEDSAEVSVADDDVRLDAAVAEPTDVKVEAAVEATEEKQVEESEEAQETEEAVAEDSVAPAGEVVPSTNSSDVTVSDATASDVTVAEEVSQEEMRRRRLYGSRLFGESRIHLGVHKPVFTERQKFYDKLYGAPSTYGSVGGDWFPVDWWVNPGLTMRLSGYSASGKAAVGAPTAQEVSDGNITLDQDSKTSLLFIPLMAGIKVEMTPFRRKWIVLEGWMGYEYGWWQETRQSTSTASIQIWSLAEETSNAPVLTNKGNKRAIVMGASANILLNWLDESGVRSMISTMGISHVYLSPFFETVKSLSTDGMSFGRNVFGVGFTFESIR